jgi:acyl-CoA synthetase (AMP-forming)/AMP-acid ligase II
MSHIPRDMASLLCHVPRWRLWAPGCLRYISTIKRAELHRHRVAIVHPRTSQSFTYDKLLADSRHLAAQLLNGGVDLAEKRVAFIAPPSYDYVAMMWAIWRAGGVCVPLCVTHPPAELAYTIKVGACSQSEMIGR